MAKNNTTLESVIEVNGQQMTIKAWLKAFAKERGYKSFKSGNVDLSPNKLAELLFDYAIKGTEPDEALADYADDIAEISAIVSDNVVTPKSKAELKAEKEQAEADQKAEQDRLNAEEAERQLAIKEGFATSMAKGADATLDVTRQFIAGIRGSFPEAIKVNANGEVMVSGDATTEDIGAAFGAAIQFNQASETTSNMLGFVIGELTNAAVAAGVYATKKACAEDIAERLAASKGKSYSVKAIENFARVAERISPELRSEEVPATVYHVIANVKQPKIQDGESTAKFEKRKQKYDKQIADIIGDVAEGKLKEVKEVKQAIEKIQKKSGLKKEGSMSLGDYLKVFVEATILAKFTGKDGNLFSVEGDDSSVELTKEDFNGLAKSALAHIINMKGYDPKGDLAVSQLLLQYREEGSKPESTEE
jgi:hypothetical protein